MNCRYRFCTNRLSSSQNEHGAYFCRASHRSAEFKARQVDAEADLRRDALIVIRSIASARLHGDDAEVGALVAEGERLLGT